MGRALSSASSLAAARHLLHEDDPFARPSKGMSRSTTGADLQIKIGRQTNQKTVPGERNAYFDSKVLSRTHAEIWNENGKVCQVGVHTQYL